MSRPDYTLRDDFELKGVWWLPNMPDNQVSGTLQYDHRDSIVLDMIGSFRDIQSFGSAEYSTPEVILGVSDNGFICTLFNTHESNRQLNFPGIPKSTYKARFLILGEHFGSFHEIKFSSLSVKYTNLENWLSARPLSLKFPHDWTEKPRAGKQFEVSYVFPDEFKVFVNSINTHIASVHELKTEGDLITESRLINNTYIKFTPGESKDLQWFLDVHHDFSNLLTILIGECVYPRKVSAGRVTKDNKEGPISILYPQDVYVDKKVDHQQFPDRTQTTQ